MVAPGRETNRAIRVLPGKVCVHQQTGGERADSPNGCLHVLSLLSFHLQWRYVQLLGVERTVLMGNQHHTLNAMNPDQKTQLLDHAFFFPEGKEVTGEACSTSRHCETVVAWEFQGVMQEIVEVLPHIARHCNRRRRHGCGSHRNTPNSRIVSCLHGHSCLCRTLHRRDHQGQSIRPPAGASESREPQ